MAGFDRDSKKVSGNSRNVISVGDSKALQKKHSDMNGLMQLASVSASSLSMENVLELQSVMGNNAVYQMLSMEDSNSEEEEEIPIQGAGLGNVKDGEEEEPETIQKKENNTGLPDNLKSGVESMSGLSMDGVKVHYNSSKPAEVGALAYTQGTDIHVAPQQERHLPHEAWHVVQQAQGRVKPTIQAKGVAINDDRELENEASVMGEKAVQMKSVDKKEVNLSAVVQNSAINCKQPIQRAIIDPNMFLAGTDRPKNKPMTEIGPNNKASGFGGDVGGKTWRTELTWDATIGPYLGAPLNWKQQGMSVRGVVGPDHPLGSPASGDGQANATLANTSHPFAPGGTWVGGHLLNAELGGPGDNVKNIHVFSTNANHTHYSLEQKAKELVNDNGMFIYFETVVNGNGFPDNSTTVTAKAIPLATNGEQYGKGWQITFNPVVDNSTGLQEIAPAVDQKTLTPAKIDNITLNPLANPPVDGKPGELTPAPFLSDQAEDYRRYDRSEFPAVNTTMIKSYLDGLCGRNKALSDLQNLLNGFVDDIMGDTSNIGWSVIQLDIETKAKLSVRDQDNLLKDADNGKLSRKRLNPEILKKTKELLFEYLVGWVRGRCK